MFCQHDFPRRRDEPNQALKEWGQHLPGLLEPWPCRRDSGKPIADGGSSGTTEGHLEVGVTADCCFVLCGFMSSRAGEVVVRLPPIEKVLGLPLHNQNA